MPPSEKRERYYDGYRDGLNRALHEIRKATTTAEAVQATKQALKSAEAVKARLEDEQEGLFA